ncbi:tRNA pseudouridine(54/55) synthase Pus10 [Candidatus Bipolaricaulota bacterium]|nr:tRNA pseudouridine(54/55) synthase Pus10 [Candidatus Bipolaricaulota bacterium]
MEIEEKRDALLEEDLCDRCLGRQFGELGHGLENYERGMIVRELDDPTEDSFTKDNVPEGSPDHGDYALCGGLFCNLGEYVDMVESKLTSYEIDTLVVGSRVPRDVERREKELWEDYGDRYARPIKSELNRLVGRKVQEDLGVEADFERPDVNPVLDLRNHRVELQVNSLLFYGRYNKYVRGIPQTVWHCNECGGRGCEKCDYTGKKYHESVQEIIQDPFIEATDAAEAKFHGAGREDVDARCFGRREFMLELKEPRKRNLVPRRIQTELNRSQSKVEVFGMEEAEKSRVEVVKTEYSDKTYRAVVELSRKTKELPLEKLASIPGTIKQRTPCRVSHRRADKVRKREVYWLHWEELGRKNLELTTKTEAGTYVKELISGDEGRTEPSVADTLNCEASCLSLDVLDIS